MAALLVSAFLLAAISWVDYATGTEMSVAVFYFVPVTTVGWYGGRRLGLLGAVLAAGCWAIFNQLNGPPYSKPWLPYWEAGSRLVAFIVLAVMSAQISYLLARERRMKEELEAAASEAKELEGLISVCAWCRKIRNDAGYWERFERFFGHHLKAKFSHAMCPECLAKSELEDARGGNQGSKGPSRE